MQGEEHLYKEDWGEQLIGKYQTVVVVCNVDEEKFTILENIPENWCPGQVRIKAEAEEAREPTVKNLCFLKHFFKEIYFFIKSLI